MMGIAVSGITRDWKQAPCPRKAPRIAGKTNPDKQSIGDSTGLGSVREAEMSDAGEVGGLRGAAVPPSELHSHRPAGKFPSFAPLLSI